MKATRIATLAVIVSTLMAGISIAGYTNVTFDAAPYTLGLNFFDNPTEGWEADTNTVEVTDSDSVSGAQSVFVATDASVSNAVGLAPSKVWTDFRIRPMLGVEPTNNLPSGSASMIMYFDSDGYVGIYTGSVFNVCSNDIFGNALTPVTASAFTEISIFQDFGTKSAVVFVDGVAVMQDIPFPALTANYNYFVVANVESNAWIDNVRIQTNYLDAVDQVSDGNFRLGDDQLEVQTYGYIGRTFTIGPDDYTFAEALALYRGNDILDVVAGSYAESVNVTTTLAFQGGAFTIDSLTVADGAALTLDNSVTVTGTVQVAGSGSIDLAAGKTLNAQTQIDLNGTATLFVNSGATVTTADLEMENGTKLQVTDADFSSTAELVDLSGTFTIYGNYWPGPSPVGLPFVDKFDTYQVGAEIGNYGFFGWYTSDTNIKVVANGYTGQGLILPDGTTLSNRITTVAGETNIWTTYYVKANRGVSPADPQTDVASFLGFVNTNGYMQVALTNDQWLICSTNLAGGAVTEMDTNAWTRVDIHVSIGGVNNGRFALFVDGFIVAQQQAFPGNASDYTSLIAQSNDGDAWLDDIRISVDLPTGLTQDVDGNDLPDGYEIHQYGYIGRTPLGALFKFR